jgi:hypothetical protein
LLYLRFVFARFIQGLQLVSKQHAALNTHLPEQATCYAQYAHLSEQHAALNARTCPKNMLRSIQPPALTSPSLNTHLSEQHATPNTHLSEQYATPNTHLSEQHATPNTRLSEQQHATPNTHLPEQHAALNTRTCPNNMLRSIRAPVRTTCCAQYTHLSEQHAAPNTRPVRTA